MSGLLQDVMLRAAADGTGIDFWSSERTLLEVSQGSLYPALHRLEHRGMIGRARGERLVTADAQILETADSRYSGAGS